MLNRQLIRTSSITNQSNHRMRNPATTSDVLRTPYFSNIDRSKVRSCQRIIYYGVSSCWWFQLCFRPKGKNPSKKRHVNNSPKSIVWSLALEGGLQRLGKLSRAYTQVKSYSGSFQQLAKPPQNVISQPPLLPAKNNTIEFSFNWVCSGSEGTKSTVKSTASYK